MEPVKKKVWKIPHLGLKKLKKTWSKPGPDPPPSVEFSTLFFDGFP